MTLDLKQIWTWDDQRRLVDCLYINTNQITIIERYSEDSTFDPAGIFLSTDGSGPVLGLTVWSITMSSGRKIQVPVPWNCKSNIWEQLQIPVP